MNFGEVFRYREQLYVYLVQKDDITYAAKIIPKEITDKLVKRRDIKGRDSQSRIQNQTLFCFVVLSTESFRDQSAHYGAPQMETEGIDVAQPVSVLNDDDIENLKREIKEDTATYKDLRETIIKLFP
jgi:hypothetical protein